MKKNNLPLFTAELTLENKQARGHYHKVADKGFRQGITPQLRRLFPPLGCNHFCVCIVDSLSDPDNCPCCDSIDINHLMSFIR